MCDKLMAWHAMPWWQGTKWPVSILRQAKAASKTSAGSAQQASHTHIIRVPISNHTSNTNSNTKAKSTQVKMKSKAKQP